VPVQYPNENYPNPSHAPPPSTLLASIDIDQCTSMRQLEQQASLIEAEIQEFVRLKTVQLDHVRGRIESLKNAKKLARKRCTSEGCTNFAHRGGVCVRHGATLKRCSHEGCTKKAQRGGVCVKHGAEVPRCKIEGCVRYTKRGGVCGFHGGRRCSREGCDNQVTSGGTCDQHGENVQVRTCKFEGGCTKRAKTGGFCIKHGGTQPRYNCSHEGCSSLSKKSGLCQRHWREKNCAGQKNA